MKALALTLSLSLPGLLLAEATPPKTPGRAAAMEAATAAASAAPTSAPASATAAAPEARSVAPAPLSPPAAPAALSPAAEAEPAPEEVSEAAPAAEAAAPDYAGLASKSLAKAAAVLAVDADSMLYDDDLGEVVPVASSTAWKVEAEPLFMELAERTLRDDKEARQALSLAILRGDERAKDAKRAAYENKLAKSLIKQVQTGDEKAADELLRLAKNGNRLARVHLGMEKPAPLPTPVPKPVPASVPTATAPPATPAPEKPSAEPAAPPAAEPAIEPAAEPAAPAKP